MGYRVNVGTALALVLALSAGPATGGGPGDGVERRSSWAVGAEVARLTDPAFITHAGDGSGRIFAGGRPGRIIVFGGEGREQAPFLDISDRVSLREGGLRGLAFPYDFVDKRHFFVSYVTQGKELVVSRFRLSADGAGGDAAGEQVLMRIALPGRERPGGGLAVGLDGKLYVGVGEGAAAGKSRGQAQDLGSPVGKILRIEASPGAARNAAPLDNPYAKRPDARPEIWATGVGNPAWIGVDPETGELTIIDSLGERHEEIEVQPGTSGGGENYGWNVVEGIGCRASLPCETARFTPPALFLSHSAVCELAGGAVVRRGAPPNPEVMALFGDRCSGRLLELRRSEGGNWESRTLLETGLRIAALGAGQSGDIYVADRKTGRIHAIVPAPLVPSP